MSERPSKKIAIQLLGSFRAVGEPSGQCIDLKSKKARALLSFLAMQDDFSASREKISNLLWVDHADANARHSLRQCLVALRKELNDVCAESVDIGREVIRLNAEALDVDARRLMAFKNIADHRALLSLLHSLQADFLADISINDAFDTWVLEQRKKLAGKVGDILKELSLQEDIADIGAQATAAAERLITIDPLREDWRRILFALSARVHGRARALARYKEYLVFLRDEQPSQATVALIEQIAQGEFVSGDAAADLPIKTSAPSKTRAEARRPIASRKRPAQVEAPSVPAISKWRLASIGAGPAVAFGVMGLVLLGTAAGTLSEGGALVATPMQQVVSSSQGDPLQGRAAIAVLPLHSNDQDFVALRQQIIHKLSKLRIARLIANEAIGSQPHYRLAVESESASPGLAVVKLTDPTGIRLWQQEFKLGEAEFTLSDIAKQVGHETEIQLVRGEARAAARNDVDVTALLLAARAEQNRGQTGKEDARSVKLYERALRADGESAIAMAGIAGQLVARQLRSLVQDPEADRRAELLLRRSITIDPSLPMAHFFMGLLHKSRGHGNQAVLSFNRTLELNPSFAPAYANLGHALMLLGRPEEGMDNIRQAMRISPNDAYFATWAMFAGEIEFERGNVPVALGWFELALTRSPALARCYGWLAAAYQEVGDFAAASRHMQEFKALLGNLSSRKLSERLRQFPEGGLQQSRPRLYQALLKTADYVR